MSFELKRLANGYYVIELSWRSERTALVKLTLTDPDGDQDIKTITWAPDTDTPIGEALSMFAEHLNALPHIRAIANGIELAIGPADPDYTLNVEVEMVS